jgi:hypothetical protein
MSDARLQALYERGLTLRGTPHRASCVAPDRILALVERRGAEEERLATLDHVMACPACGADYELLRSIAPPQARRRWPVPTMATLAAAAMLLVAVGVTAVVSRSPGDDGPDVMRGAADRLELVGVTGVAEHGGSLQVAWRPVPGAISYEVEVLRADGARVTGVVSPDTTAILALDQSALGDTLSWWVRARTSAGATVRSAVTPLRLPAR